MSRGHADSARTSAIAFMGDTKGGPFDIDAATRPPTLLAAPNPDGRSNADVVRPWVNGLDITRRPRDMWIIDFGLDMPEERPRSTKRPSSMSGATSGPSGQNNGGPRMPSGGGSTSRAIRACGRHSRGLGGSSPRRS